MSVKKLRQTCQTVMKKVLLLQEDLMLMEEIYFENMILMSPKRKMKKKRTKLKMKMRMKKRKTRKKTMMKQMMKMMSNMMMIVMRMFRKFDHGIC